MKIAQVAPLYEAVPPKLYGGTERVVHFLTESLVDLGHDVTLFASGDSKTSAKLVACCAEALRLVKSTDPYAAHVRQLQDVVEAAGQFDIIHFHTDYFHFPISRLGGYTHVTTLHGRQDITEVQALYRKFNDMPVTSISYAQRTPIPYANWVGNVYHGISKSVFRFGNGEGKFALFLGRISPEKRVDRAIEIAGKAGLQLKIAAKIDKHDQAYFDTNIKHLLSQPHVEFIGEVTDKEKERLLGQAAALLFPIDWPEPFGMVMVEAMACGTPVIAYGLGSVPEIIEHGCNGFIVSSIEEAVTALDNISLIDRNTCRQRFLERFEATRMAEDYLQIYTQLIHENENSLLSLRRANAKKDVKNSLSA